MASKQRKGGTIAKPKVGPKGKLVAAKSTNKIPQNKKAKSSKDKLPKPKPVVPAAGFSLYSEESDDQVGSLNQQLDMCEQVLAQMMERRRANDGSSKSAKTVKSHGPVARTLVANPPYNKRLASSTPDPEKVPEEYDTSLPDTVGLQLVPEREKVKPPVGAFLRELVGPPHTDQSPYSSQQTSGVSSQLLSFQNGKYTINDQMPMSERGQIHNSVESNVYPENPNNALDIRRESDITNFQVYIPKEGSHTPPTFGVEPRKTFSEPFDIHLDGFFERKEPTHVGGTRSEGRDATLPFNASILSTEYASFPPYNDVHNDVPQEHQNVGAASQENSLEFRSPFIPIEPNKNGLGFNGNMQVYNPAFEDRYIRNDGAHNSIAARQNVGPQRNHDRQHPEGEGHVMGSALEPTNQQADEHLAQPTECLTPRPSPRYYPQQYDGSRFQIPERDIPQRNVNAGIMSAFAGSHSGSVSSNGRPNPHPQNVAYNSGIPAGVSQGSSSTNIARLPFMSGGHPTDNQPQSNCQYTQHHVNTNQQRPHAENNVQSMQTVPEATNQMTPISVNQPMNIMTNRPDQMSFGPEASAAVKYDLPSSRAQNIPENHAMLIDDQHRVSAVDRSPESLKTLKFLLKELRVVGEINKDVEIGRLTNDVEAAINGLPQMEDMGAIRSEIDLAVQPLRNENSQLRRRLRIVNQQLRDRERLEKAGQIPDTNMEVSHLQLMNSMLERQLEEEKSRRDQFVKLVEDLQKDLDKLRTDRHQLLLALGEKDNDQLKIREDSLRDLSKLQSDLNILENLKQGMKLKLDAAEQENHILRISLEQRDMEISRLQEVVQSVKSGVHGLTEEMETSVLEDKTWRPDSSFSLQRLLKMLNEQQGPIPSSPAHTIHSDPGNDTYKHKIHSVYRALQSENKEIPNKMDTFSKVTGPHRLTESRLAEHNRQLRKNVGQESGVVMSKHSPRDEPMSACDDMHIANATKREVHFTDPLQHYDTENRVKADETEAKKVFDQQEYKDQPTFSRNSALGLVNYDVAIDSPTNQSRYSVTDYFKKYPHQNTGNKPVSLVSSANATLDDNRLAINGKSPYAANQNNLYKGTALDNSLSAINDDVASVSSVSTAMTFDDRAFRQGLAALDANIVKLQNSLKDTKQLLS